MVGIWPRSPLGRFLDVMVETAAGHRILLAPSVEVADYVSSTYTFDEIRVEPLALRREGPMVGIDSDSLTLRYWIGARTLLSAALLAVPTRLARARWWTALLDPIARAALPGVRTRGSAGNGREEYYTALDLHRVGRLAGAFDGTDLGGLAPVRPAVRFGFGSAPAKPAVVRIVTTIVQR